MAQAPIRLRTFLRLAAMRQIDFDVNDVIDRILVNSKLEKTCTAGGAAASLRASQCPEFLTC
jgi:hypothetical protein